MWAGVGVPAHLNISPTWHNWHKITFCRCRNCRQLCHSSSALQRPFSLRRRLEPPTTNISKWHCRRRHKSQSLSFWLTTGDSSDIDDSDDICDISTVLQLWFLQHLQ